MAMKDEAQRFAEAVAAQVRAEIAARSKSVASVARATGINRETLNRWVKGERPFAVGTLFQVADALDMDTHLLVERAERRFEEESPRSNVTHAQFGGVGGAREDDLVIPDNVEEEWAGRYAADPAGDDPIDHGAP